MRVYRDELLSIQVDGTEGSAIAGLRGCKTQHRVNTPRPTWNPDIENPFDFYADWQDVPDNGEFDNAFKYPVGDVPPSRRDRHAVHLRLL